jgi:hypothetical protein
MQPDDPDLVLGAPRRASAIGPNLFQTNAGHAKIVHGRTSEAHTANPDDDTLVHSKGGETRQRCRP